MNDNLIGVFRSIRRKFLSFEKPLTALQPIDGMDRLFDNGRCLYDGYQRGAALRYGSLSDEIWRDPVFRKARSAARLPEVNSMVDEERLQNLFLIIKFFLRDLASQNIVEFGSFKGGSAVFMGTLLKEFYPGACVYSIDTFEGVPDILPGVDMPPQDFAAANLERTRRFVISAGLTNVEFVKGRVEDIGPEVCSSAGMIGLAHIDVVLYSPSVSAANAAWDYMAPGGYIIQDDATEPTCPGATQAVEELIRNKNASIEQVWPHIVFRAPLGVGAGNRAAMHASASAA
jgi:predicted O-methyltransferase YrrM